MGPGFTFGKYIQGSRDFLSSPPGADGIRNQIGRSFPSIMAKSGPSKFKMEDSNESQHKGRCL